MDRRTLVFFVSLTFTLFLVNLFFTHQAEERNREWYEQHRAKEAQSHRDLAADIERRTKTAQQLPIVDLYADETGTTYLASGVQAGDAVVVVWDRELPESVYAKLHNTLSDLKPLKRHGKAQTHSPILYSSEGDGPTTVGDLPDVGTFDLQLLSVDDSGIRVTLGEFRDGGLFIPAEDLDIEIANKETLLPNDHAIVLRKTAKGFVPVGIYSAQDHSLIYLKNFTNLGPLTTLQEASTPAPTVAPAKEQFFVIENAYQQLVFSSIGGALVEINLPFETRQNTQSVVKEIEIDRQIAEEDPAGARFPLHTYHVASENGKGPYPEQEGKVGGYYPLLRRDLITASGQPLKNISPRYYACNLVSDFPEVAERSYEVTYFDQNKIVFESTAGRRKITRTYVVNPEVAPYCVDLTLDLEGDARGLWLTSGVPDVELISGAPAPSIKYRITRNGGAEVINVDPPSDTITFSSINPDWISNGNGFFGLILDPVTPIDAGYKAVNVANSAVPSRLNLIDVGRDGVKDKDFPGYNVLLPLKTSGGSMKFRLYAGPYSSAMLERVDAAYTDPTTGYNPDYLASQTFHGWFAFISEPFAKLLFILMKGFHSLTGSWAISIILLTVALRLMLYPLNAWSMRSTLKMQELSPDIQALNEKYKKDPKKIQIETMNLYRERGVNPLSGCFPLLIQLPFLIAMFDLLRSTFELRGACAVPGWIDNLTSPDVLFSWTTPIPLIGNQFHLLPIILGACMFLQQRMMSPTPTDASQMTEQQRQARAMSTLMAPVFTILFYSFPSGLNIYWLSSTILGVGQQWLMAKQMKSRKPATVVVIAKPAKPPGKKGKG